MKAVTQLTDVRYQALDLDWLDRLLPIEQAAYSHPWTRGNFEDAIRAGYYGQLMLLDDQLIGYFVAMKGVDEVHLLNITVAPHHQKQGWARILLDELVAWSISQGAHWLWLEVRQSNRHAIAVYHAYGFRRIGMRRGYYPAAMGKREDAVVMNLPLEPSGRIRS